MENTNNKKGKLDFPDNIIDVLKDILEKIQNRQPLFGPIMMSVVKDLVFGNIQEKDMAGLLQQKLNISQIDAENLASDLKTKLIPLIKKFPDEETDEIEEREKQKTDIFPKIKPPIGVEEILEKPKVNSSEKKTVETPQDNSIVTPAPKRRSRLPKKPTLETDIPAQPKKQSSGSDKYREPI